MRKVRLTIEETLRYTRDMVIEIPDDMGVKGLGNLLNRTENNADSAEDFQEILKQQGVNVLKGPDSFMDSPDRQEVECVDYREIEEGTE
ncbi:hypothetical protein [Brevibacillus laterosporus]|uniref:hypothetical protein n=1 Tax=Brevibacillus laterosporus TaxID=1465 RepID=UPI003D1EE8A3